MRCREITSSIIKLNNWFSIIYIHNHHDKAKQSKTKHFKSCVLILDTVKRRPLIFSDFRFHFPLPPYLYFDKCSANKGQNHNPQPHPQHGPSPHAMKRLNFRWLSCLMPDRWLNLGIDGYAAGMGLVPWNIIRRAGMDVVDECARGLSALIPTSVASTRGLIKERASNRA